MTNDEIRPNDETRIGVEIKAANSQISFLRFLVAEAAHFDRHQLRQLAREIIDMNAGAAVDMRRIFVREEERLHADSLIAQAQSDKWVHIIGRVGETNVDSGIQLNVAGQAIG